MELRLEETDPGITVAALEKVHGDDVVIFYDVLVRTVYPNLVLTWPVQAYQRVSML